MDFCYLCGTKLKPNDDYFDCPGCGQKHYLNPRPCVDIALFNDDGQVLLAKRAKEPYKGKYDMPGGFVDAGESNEQAIKREIKEELDLDTRELKDLKYVTSYSSDYPWGHDEYKLIVALFTARTSDVNIEARDDVESVRWEKPGQINPSDLANPKLLKTLQQIAEVNQP